MNVNMLSVRPSSCVASQHSNITFNKVVFCIISLCTGCAPVELWDLPAAGFTFLANISSLNDTAAQYPICDDSSVESAVLLDTTLNIATVTYLTGTTPGSRACFVCDEDSGYESNTTSSVRVCQNDGTWSGNPITCGTFLSNLMFNM